MLICWLNEYILLSFPVLLCVHTVTGRLHVTGFPSVYKYERKPMTWKKANVACLHWGGYLVSIPSQAHNDQLVRNLKDRKIDRAWIGYNDRKDEDTFKWLQDFDGYSDGYTNWKSLGPNGGLKENCVEMTSKNGGKWDDVNCDNERAFICERPDITSAVSDVRAIRGLHNNLLTVKWKTPHCDNKCAIIYRLRISRGITISSKEHITVYNTWYGYDDGIGGVDVRAEMYGLVGNYTAATFVSDKGCANEYTWRLVLFTVLSALLSLLLTSSICCYYMRTSSKQQRVKEGPDNHLFSGLQDRVRNAEVQNICEATRPSAPPYSDRNAMLSENYESYTPLVNDGVSNSKINGSTDICYLDPPPLYESIE